MRTDKGRRATRSVRKPWLAAARCGGVGDASAHARAPRGPGLHRQPRQQRGHRRGPQLSRHRQCPRGASQWGHRAWFGRVRGAGVGRRLRVGVRRGVLADLHGEPGVPEGPGGGLLPRRAAGHRLQPLRGGGRQRLHRGVHEQQRRRGRLLLQQVRRRDRLFEVPRRPVHRG